MADVTINHQRVEQAVEDMKQATRQMHTAAGEPSPGMAPMASSFVGVSATAWQEFQAVAEEPT